MHSTILVQETFAYSLPRCNVLKSLVENEVITSVCLSQVPSFVLNWACPVNRTNTVN